MKSSASLALLSAFGMALAFAGGGVVGAAQAQSAPVQTEQTPAQADQSRAQERSRAEDTKIGRGWKAQDTSGDTAGRAAADRSHETVGRDWRAHPEGQDR